MIPFDLHDRQSGAFLKIRTHLENRLEMLRAKNDKDVSERETAKLRGEIAEVKALLSEMKEPEKPAAKTINRYT